MTALVVLRHGPTDWSAERRLQGRTDVPLSPEGRQRVLRWRLPPDVPDHDWISSPLARAVDTARLLGGLPAVEPRLIEMSFGAWEGHRLAELRAAAPDDVAERERQGLDFRAPDGESYREVQTRLSDWLVERAALGRPILAICHKAVIRALYALAVGWDMTGPPPDRLADDTCHRLDLAPDGTPVIDRLNVPLLPVAP